MIDSFGEWDRLSPWNALTSPWKSPAGQGSNPSTWTPKSGFQPVRICDLIKGNQWTKSRRFPTNLVHANFRLLTWLKIQYRSCIKQRPGDTFLEGRTCGFCPKHGEPHAAWAASACLHMLAKMLPWAHCPQCRYCKKSTTNTLQKASHPKAIELDSLKPCLAPFGCASGVWQGNQWHGHWWRNVMGTSRFAKRRSPGCRLAIVLSLDLRIQKPWRWQINF